MTALESFRGAPQSNAEGSGLVACAVYSEGRRIAELGLEQISQPIHRDQGFV
jgi:hypothetical protein